ncbi:MAG: 2-oxoacid:acceptor oxidoreductase family protein [Candidatus Diapherotrites archaeon]|nr:2-oxoacid:acceptor oxidoreductase family protein [Candidatus Diapherotrites archaeon]
MEEKIISAGFGGQGVLLIGKILALAGLSDGKQVSWVPSYGPEMRGGTANCTVIISSSEISSPLAPMPDSIIIMNKPSLEAFEPLLRKGGLLVMNSSLIDVKPKRSDIKAFSVPANDIAEKDAGNVKAANMVMLGAYAALSDSVSMDSVKKALEGEMKGEKQKFLPVNMKALELGAAAAKKK